MSVLTSRFPSCSMKPRVLHHPQSSRSIRITSLFLPPRCESCQDRDKDLNLLKRYRKLYGVLYTILDQIYGQNLGYGDDLPISSIITRLFSMEGSLIDWESKLPRGLGIIQPNEVAQRLAQDEPASPSHLALKLQMVLTLRYLNVRLLLHRAVLVRVLGSNGSAGSVDHEAALLQHVGPNSTKTCLDSALHTLDLVHATVTSPGSHKEVLGAWWFSLYYSEFLLP